MVAKALTGVNIHRDGPIQFAIVAPYGEPGSTRPSTKGKRATTGFPGFRKAARFSEGAKHVRHSATGPDPGSRRHRPGNRAGLCLARRQSRSAHPTRPHRIELNGFKRG